ncbi:MAG: Ig-like domain-containing protein, partial [Firmicutes bacterium]|nr:Ig-like domain-containing protein [Bacillota bacterium]
DYDLVGWATSDNATAANIYAMPAANRTVYAVWKASTADSATKTAAANSIKAAKEDMDATVVSANGTDVWTTDKWVNQAHNDAMAAAIQKAEGVVNKDGVTTVEIKAAMEELASAKATFERDKRDGTKSQPTAEEQAIIDGAKAALKDTKVSNDGTDVEPSEMWVSPEVKDNLAAAVEAAEAAIADDSKNGAAKTAAIQAVAEAKEAFDEAKKPGDQAAADARALAKAKTDAKAELDKVNPNNYEEPEKSTVTKAVEDGKKAIDAATTIPQVNDAKKKAQDTVAAQKTAAQKQAERDAEQKKKDEEQKKAEDPKNIPAEVTAKTPANLVAVTKAITASKNDGDLKGSTYAPLKFMSKQQTKKNIKLQWSKVKGAKQYTVYANQCGKKNKYKKLATVKASKKALNVKKVAGKKLKKATNYKFLIIAENGDKVSAISKTLHIRTAGHKKYTNYKSVSVKKAVIKKAKKLKRGKTLKLNAKGVAPKGKKVSVHVKTRYESANKKIATVNKAGKVKGIKKGKTKIYCYVQNGLAKVVTVTVK